MCFTVCEKGFKEAELLNLPLNQSIQPSYNDLSTPLFMDLSLLSYCLSTFNLNTTALIKVPYIIHVSQAYKIHITPPLNIFCRKIENLYNWMENLRLNAENIIAKEEIAHFEQFLLLSLCFQIAVCCRGVRKRLYEGKG